MAMMVEAANLGISVVSEQGLILEVNPYWTQLTGRDASELIGQRVSSMLASNEDEAHRRYRDSVKPGRDRVLEVIRHRDGHVVWLESSTQVVMLDGMPQILVITQDVTERVEAERRVYEQTMERGRLAGGLAHDFNNLLAVIITNAHLLIEDLGAADPRLADATEIAAAGARAAALTKQLLALSLEKRLVITSGRDVAGTLVPAPIVADVRP
jgi:PAS domain S-box-containing protein